MATQAAHAHDDTHGPSSGHGGPSDQRGGHAPEAFHSHRAKYLKVFGALIVLTGLELGVVYAGLPKTTLITLLIGLALAKAGAVALWFMHLADERPVLRMMVGFPLMFPPLYACVLIAEAFFRSHFM